MVKMMLVHTLSHILGLDHFSFNSVLFWLMSVSKNNKCHLAQCTTVESHEVAYT